MMTVYTWCFVCCCLCCCSLGKRNVSSASGMFRLETLIRSHFKGSHSHFKEKCDLKCSVIQFQIPSSQLVQKGHPAFTYVVCDKKMSESEPTSTSQPNRRARILALRNLTFRCENKIGPGGQIQIDVFPLLWFTSSAQHHRSSEGVVSTQPGCNTNQPWVVFRKNCSLSSS